MAQPVFSYPQGVIPFSKPQKKGINEKPIRFRCFLQNTILDVLKSRGWQEITEY